MFPQNVGKVVDSFSRRTKRMIMVFADTVTMPVALWAAFGLRLGSLGLPEAKFYWLFFLAPMIALPVFYFFGLYKAVVRHMGEGAVITIFNAVSIAALLLVVIAFVSGERSLPRTVMMLYWLLSLLGVGGSRFIMHSILRAADRGNSPLLPVLIYGAGSAGAQAAISLSHGREYDPVAFIDDDPQLQGSLVSDLSVLSPEKLPRLIATFGITHVLLALPSVERFRRREIVAMLEKYSIKVKTLPAMADLLSDVADYDDFREIEIEDLLGRDPVPPDQQLLDSHIKGRVVMVTGAGGSIGSELCRQIMFQGPEALVLYEKSESELYYLERELRAMLAQTGKEVRLVPMLGDVLEKENLSRALQKLSVQVIYHAAAYKHVPLVEQNVISGLRNNVLGTKRVAEVAIECGVEKVVLVSTDKAVRPTNVMGATKRLAELILQGLHADVGGGTVLSMVRFGNVLGSSGSVVPLFREQIKQGGPVTVTHPEITRFFMTIPEAAQLVIQAGAMAQGGEVFLLDMGESVKIVDLARRMIRLAGFEVKDERNPRGDIEIQFTGLRPGEKLFEEMLISADAMSTRHPMIHRATENHYSWEVLQNYIVELESVCEQMDVEEARALLSRAVREYEPAEEVVDFLV